MPRKKQEAKLTVVPPTKKQVQDVLFQMRQGTFPTSGFLSNPGGQQGPTGQSGGPTPPSRMQGDMREQEQTAQ